MITVGIDFQCTSCKKIKDLSQFAPRPETKRGHRTTCRECINNKARENHKRRTANKGVIDIPKEKVCPKCHTKKPVSAWPLNKTRNDGLGVWCRQCMSEYSAVYRERLKEVEKNTPDSKVCPVCGECKHRSKFYPASSRVDGLDWLCRKCKKNKAIEKHLDSRQSRISLRFSLVMSDSLKKCSRCHTYRPYKQFYTNLYGADATSSWCQLCVHAHYEANIETMTERNEIYRKENREKLLEYSRWYEFNIRGDSREHYRETLDAGDDITRAFLFDRDGYLCYYCKCPLVRSVSGDQRVTDSYAHIEHKIPLSRGGTHTFDNVVLACRKCNLSKGAKTDWEFIEWVRKKGTGK